jgi:hypothetical protein
VLLTHPGRLTEDGALIAKNATANCPHPRAPPEAHPGIRHHRQSRVT